jgi:hypothetical protein
MRLCMVPVRNFVVQNTLGGGTRPFASDIVFASDS